MERTFAKTPKIKLMSSIVIALILVFHILDLEQKKKKNWLLKHEASFFVQLRIESRKDIETNVETVGTGDKKTADPQQRRLWAASGHSERYADQG